MSNVDWWVHEVSYDDDHSRIVSVKAKPVIDGRLGADQIQTRQTVVAAIISGRVYWTMVLKDGKWVSGAKIEVVPIESEQFLKTEPNNVKEDNLGELPEF